MLSLVSLFAVSFKTTSLVPPLEDCWLELYPSDELPPLLPVPDELPCEDEPEEELACEDELEEEPLCEDDELEEELPLPESDWTGSGELELSEGLTTSSG